MYTFTYRHWVVYEYICVIVTDIYRNWSMHTCIHSLIVTELYMYTYVLSSLTFIVVDLCTHVYIHLLSLRCIWIHMYHRHLHLSWLIYIRTCCRHGYVQCIHIWNRRWHWSWLICMYMCGNHVCICDICMHMCYKYVYVL